jgi:hypothetical protein
MKHLLLPTLAVLVALLACKKKEDEEKPLPAPIAVPDGPTTATPPTTDTPSTPKTSDDDKSTPTTKVTKPKDGGAKDSGTTAKADAGKTQGPSAGCFSKCQAALSTCLTPQPGKDGGLPKLADPKQCQDAFTACQTACK